MSVNWYTNDYFSMLLHRDKRSHAALEMLVDDLHADKDRTISKFLCHSGSEDFLWGLVKLLGNTNSRVAGNAAYILGTLAESELGCYRVISLTSGRHSDSCRILQDLTNMLAFDDSESVMNAAGTMGTLAESHEGRTWMLSEKCLDQTLSYATDLLQNENLWTASNAALVLARLSIAEEGCERLLAHENSNHILSQLITSLGVDEAGRGMNAAFAIGRLCDMEVGRTRLLSLPQSEPMITSLAKMLCCNDSGASKNSCFALSCLATNKEGHTRLLRNHHSEEVLKTLAELLSSEDTETGWFAAMTLRTLASQPKGCLRLREHPSIVPALKSIEGREEVSGDLRDEVEQTLEILKRLKKPPPPQVQMTGPFSTEVTWSVVTTKSGFPVKYQLLEGSRCVYSGTELSCEFKDLAPCVKLVFRLQVQTEGDESPLSDPVEVTTEESVAGPPNNLRVLGCTTSQLKIGWEPPGHSNGIIKGYHVYFGKNQVEYTQELCSIISGLQPSTTYDLHVCAVNSKGKGDKETILATTADLGAHAPSKPDVIVRGRNEMHVTWKPPEVPLGRISRYDLCMDGLIIYSGMELHYTVHRLKPDKEYAFVVTAITSEGKVDSKITKKKTAKDEYEGDRAPLYQPPKKEPKDAKDSEAPDSKSDNTRISPSQLKRKSNVGLPVSSGEGPPVKSSSSRTASASSTTPSKSSHRERNQSSDRSLTNNSRPASNTSKIPSEPPQQSPLPKDSDLENRISKDPPVLPEHRSQTRSSSAKSSRVSEKDNELNMSRSVSIMPSSHLPKPKKYEPLPKPQPPPIRAINRRLSRSLDLTESAQAKSYRNQPKTLTFHNKDRLRDDKVDKSMDTKMPFILGSVDTPSRTPRHQSRSGASRTSQIEDIESAGKSPGELWGSPVRRVEQPMEVPRHINSVSSSNSSHRPRLSHRMSAGMVELDAPIPSSQRQTVPTAAMQRSNTFMASHRPGMRRHLEKLGGNKNFNMTIGNSTQQWQPEFPSDRQPEKNRNKFVPMQFRTQPANIPGGFQRQVTNLSLFDHGQPNLRIDLMSRSRTDLEMNGIPVDDVDDASSYMISKSRPSYYQDSETRMPSGKSVDLTPCRPSNTGVNRHRHLGVNPSTNSPSLLTAIPIAAHSSSENKMQSAR